ncbi:MAG TPA: hypothetical protein VGC41_18010 [Kofleriaceae bacterium]
MSAGLGGHDAGYLHALWAIASAIGVFVLAAAALIYRKARRTAEAEEVERIIREHDTHVHSRHG